jgi:hypothetical protein
LYTLRRVIPNSRDGVKVAVRSTEHGDEHLALEAISKIGERTCERGRTGCLGAEGLVEGGLGLATGLLQHQIGRLLVGRPAQIDPPDRCTRLRALERAERARQCSSQANRQHAGSSELRIEKS